MHWGWFAAPDYFWARAIFQHLLALVYLCGFLTAVNQFRPLLGEHGLTPIPRFLAAVSFRRSPSLFHWYYSDRFFLSVAWVGVVASALALIGLVNLLGLWASMVVWALLWVLYLSIVNVGQTWYAFGWESLLLEAGFLAIFLGPSSSTPPAPMLWLLCWLVFRVEFGAGLIKLRGDASWRNLTALYYHHETQPMPGPLSRLFHHLPRPLHKVEVLSNHGTQLVLPFALFLPQPIATVAALLIIITQGWLMLSGNFAWLNLVTIAATFSALYDPAFTWLLPAQPTLTDTPLWHRVLVLCVTIGVIVLSYWPVRNMLGREQVMNRSFNKLHLANTYGAFGSITRRRDELVWEGTWDTEGQSGWKEYEFKGKPGDPMRRSPQIAPYHLRLDWLMWFCAIAPGYGRSWLPRLLHALLRNDQHISRLLRHNPFSADQPPALIRVRLFHYRFSTRAEYRNSGAWWIRTYVTDYLPPMSLAAVEDAFRG